jgi:hypothetical protein
LLFENIYDVIVIVALAFLTVVNHFSCEVLAELLNIVRQVSLGTIKFFEGLSVAVDYVLVSCEILSCLSQLLVELDIDFSLIFKLFYNSSFYRQFRN